MAWSWRATVFAVTHRDDLVILDIRDNAYIALAAGARAVQNAPGQAGLTVLDPELTESLSRAGLLQWRDAAKTAQPDRRLPVVEPQRDLTAAAPVTAGWRDGVRLAGCVVALIWRYRLCSFERLVRARQLSAVAEPAAADEAATIRAVQVFAGLMPWVPFQGQCLYRAALLRTFLGQSGAAVTWVFGVRTWPFAAHCWLQRGDLVLNDRLDVVRRYTPILTV